MIVKIVNLYLDLSLVLWAVWGHFEGGSLCLTSVCWSLQCLISVLTWWGGGGHFFFFFQAHLVSLTVGREGCCKQITLSCARSVSAPLGLSLLVAHKPLQLYDAQWEPSEAGPRLRAPPLSKPLRFGTQVALRGADSVETVFCALPRSEYLRCLASAVAATCRLFCLCCSAFWVYCWHPL